MVYDTNQFYFVPNIYNTFSINGWHKIKQFVCWYVFATAFQLHILLVASPIIRLRLWTYLIIIQKVINWIQSSNDSLTFFDFWYFSLTFKERLQKFFCFTAKNNWRLHNVSLLSVFESRLNDLSWMRIERLKYQNNFNHKNKNLQKINSILNELKSSIKLTFCQKHLIIFFKIKNLYFYYFMQKFAIECH